MNREAMILKARRIELGLSQTDVALNSGISIQQYQKFEYGDRILSQAGQTFHGSGSNGIQNGGFCTPLHEQSAGWGA